MLNKISELKPGYKAHTTAFFMSGIPITLIGIVALTVILTYRASPSANFYFLTYFLTPVASMVTLFGGGLVLAGAIGRSHHLCKFRSAIKNIPSQGEKIHNKDL